MVRSHVPLQWAESESPPPTLHTNPSENSRAWKKYSYLDEGSARGTVWHNRRRIQCTVACIESDSNTAPFTEGNQIWQSCVKILICLERISTPYFGEKWKSMLTAACQCYIFRTSDLNRETSLRKRGITKRDLVAKGQSYIVDEVKTQSRKDLLMLEVFCILMRMDFLRKYTSYLHAFTHFPFHTASGMLLLLFEIWHITLLHKWDLTYFGIHKQIPLFWYGFWDMLLYSIPLTCL